MDVTPVNTEARPARRRVAAFVGVWLVIGLVVAEVAVRLLDRPPPAPYLDHPYLRRVRSPSVDLDLVDPFERRPFVLHVDGHGFRSRTLEPPGTPKTPGSYRVFFVGASTTENVALPDEQTFPWLVEAALNERTGSKPLVRGINCGLSGNSIVDSFSIVAHSILTLEPDLIVYMDCANDMRTGMSPRFDPASVADTRGPRPIRFSAYFRQHCRLYDVVERARERLAEPRVERYRAMRRETPFTQGLDPARGLPHFRRYLRMISAVCRDAHVPLALMTQPALYKEKMTEEEEAALYLGSIDHDKVNADTRTMMRGMHVFNEAVRQVAHEGGHLLIELEAAVPRDLRHFYDDFHYTARGCKAVARAIVEDLMKDGHLPAPP